MRLVTAISCLHEAALFQLGMLDIRNKNYKLSFFRIIVLIVEIFIFFCVRGKIGGHKIITDVCFFFVLIDANCNELLKMNVITIDKCVLLK